MICVEIGNKKYINTKKYNRGTERKYKRRNLCINYFFLVLVLIIIFIYSIIVWK